MSVDYVRLSKGLGVTAGAMTIPVDITDGTSVDPAGEVFRSQSDLDAYLAANSTSNFKNVGPVLACLPQTLAHNVTLNIASGTYAAVDIPAFQGKGVLRFVGTIDLMTPATGSATGTAGAGTSSTSIVGASWTADDFQQHLIEITSGGGAPAVRPCLTNDATTITVHAIAGADNTSVYRIGSPGAVIGAMTSDGCRAPIEFYGCDVASFSPVGFRKVTMEAAKLQNANSLADLGDHLRLINTVVMNNVDFQTDGVRKVEVTNVFVDDGSISIVDAAKAITEIEAHACDQTALYMEDVRRAQIGFNAVDCTATPMDLVGVNASPAGTGIAGTNNTGAFGISISEGTWIDLVGHSTLSGSTNDLEVQGQAMGYTQIQNSGGTGWNRGSAAVVSSGTGTITADQFTANSDHTIGGSMNLFGLFRMPFSQVTATGSDLAGAAAMANVASVINGGAVDTGVRLFATPAWAGEIQMIFNDSGSNKKIYPGNASHTIGGGGAGVPVNLADGAGLICFAAVGGTDWKLFGPL